MNLQSRKEALLFLGEYLQQPSEEWDNLAIRAKVINPWFTIENIQSSIDAIATHYLSEQALETVIEKYKLDDNIATKKIGLVLAGNLPLVGIHDWIITFLVGHKAIIKTSEKDTILFTHLVAQLTTQFPDINEYITLIDGPLQGFDAVIATGSDNTSRYFDYYFKQHPSIIRKNRASLAVLDGNESKEQLDKLADDVFQYFGLGCRNVSKVFVPKGYDLNTLNDSFARFADYIHHNKFKNNYDYNYAIYIVNQIEHQQVGPLLMLQNEALVSRISSLHFDYYDSIDEVNQFIDTQKDKIQCIVGENVALQSDTLAFGAAQQPSILDYADNVDTAQFLLALD